MNRVVFSSASDHWATPKAVYEALDSEFHFDFDPCPLHTFDGLIANWHGNVFCNPPYSNIRKFLSRGLAALAEKRVHVVVYLLPSRTDTKWFHEYAIKAREIRFLRGRLKFGSARFGAPFPSMVVIFDKWDMPEMCLLS